MNLNWHNYSMNKATYCKVAGIFVAFDLQLNSMTQLGIISQFIKQKNN